MSERKPEYEFEIELPGKIIGPRRTVRGESMAVLAGCLVIFSDTPILCLAPGAWVSAERLWEAEVEEVRH